jgi:hypothetical protein
MMLGDVIVQACTVITWMSIENNLCSVQLDNVYQTSRLCSRRTTNAGPHLDELRFREISATQRVELFIRYNPPIFNLLL